MTKKTKKLLVQSNISSSDTDIPSSLLFTHLPLAFSLSQLQANIIGVTKLLSNIAAILLSSFEPDATSSYAFSDLYREIKF